MKSRRTQIAHLISRGFETPPGFAERAFVFITFFIGIGALISIRSLSSSTIDLPSDSDQGDPIVRTFWGLVYAVSAVLLLALVRPVVYLLKRNPFLPALLALGVASSLWSLYPATTLRQSLTTAAVGLFGYYLAARFSTSYILKTLLRAIILALALSIAAVFLLPSLGTYSDADGSAWRGVFLFKNSLGRAAALGLIVAAVLYFANADRRLWLSGAVLAVFCLLGASSATALVSALAGITALLILRGLFSRKYRDLILLAVIGSTALLVATLLIGINPYTETLAFLGKDPTLTGRSTIWQAVLPYIREHLVFGWGYNGFWRGLNGPSAGVWMQTTERPPHAHNAYLETMISLGVIGLICFLMAVMVSFARAIEHIFSGEKVTGMFGAGYLVFLLVQGSSENVFLQPNSIYWALFCFVAASTAFQVSHRPPSETSPTPSAHRFGSEVSRLQ